MTRDKTRQRRISSTSYIPHNLTINDCANAPVAVGRLKKAALTAVKPAKCVVNGTRDDHDGWEPPDIENATSRHRRLIFWMINTKKGFNFMSTAKGTLCSFLATLGIETPEKVIVDATYLTVRHTDARHPTALEAKFANQEIRDAVFTSARSKEAQYGVHVSFEYEYSKRRRRAVLNQAVMPARKKGYKAELIDDKLIIDGNVYVCENSEMVALENGERFDVGELPIKHNPSAPRLRVVNGKRYVPVKRLNLLFFGLECCVFNYDAYATCAYNSVCKYLMSLGLTDLPRNMIESAYHVGPSDEGNPCTPIIKVSILQSSFLKEILVAARGTMATSGVKIAREIVNADAFKTNRVLLQYLAKARQLDLRAILLTDQIRFGGKTYYCDNKGRNLCEENGQRASLRKYVKKTARKNIDDRPPNDAHLHLLFSGIYCICTEDGKCAMHTLCSFLSSMLGIKSPQKMILSASHLERPVEYGQSEKMDIKAKFLKFDDVHAVIKLVRGKRIPGITVRYNAPDDSRKGSLLKSEDIKFYTTQQPAKLLIEKKVYVCDKNGNVVSNVDGTPCDLSQIAASVPTSSHHALPHTEIHQTPNSSNGFPSATDIPQQGMISKTEPGDTTQLWKEDGPIPCDNINNNPRFKNEQAVADVDKEEDDRPWYEKDLEEFDVDFNTCNSGVDSDE